MCRLMAYKGTPIIIDKLLYQPKNSLVNQSINAREIEEPLNGDGFGIGWYVPEVNYEPVTFVSVNPAWSTETFATWLQKLKPNVCSPMCVPQVWVKSRSQTAIHFSTKIC